MMQCLISQHMILSFYYISINGCLCGFFFRSAQAASKKTYLSSKSEPSVPQNYLDYMILDPRQSSSLRMQALPLDPYTYLQV